MDKKLDKIRKCYKCICLLQDHSKTNLQKKWPRTTYSPCWFMFTSTSAADMKLRAGVAGQLTTVMNAVLNYRLHRLCFISIGNFLSAWFLTCNVYFFILNACVVHNILSVVYAMVTQITVFFMFSISITKFSVLFIAANDDSVGVEIVIFHYSRQRQSRK